MPQNKSAFSDSLAVRVVPSAVTIAAYIWLVNVVQRGPARRDTYLEKVVNNEAMLTCEKPETSSKEEALNAMSDSSHPCKLRSVPSNPCLYYSQYRMEYKSC
jgi:hypothetical protein